MSEEKSYIDFIVLHERSNVTKEVDVLQKNITSSTRVISNVVSDSINEEIQEVNAIFEDTIKKLKKVLVKHNLYDL